MSYSANQLKQRFVRQLAVYLAYNQAKQSIWLEMGKESAKDWASLRACTPLSGYPTVDEAEQQLAEWLGISTTAEV